MITSASRAQLWLTILTCLIARLALPGVDFLSLAWATAALVTGIFCQRLISGERYYWAGAPVTLKDTGQEQIFLFGDFIETEVEEAREKSYLYTAGSTQRTYLLAGGVAAIVLVSFTFLRMSRQVNFHFPDVLMLVCALTLLPAMTPRHFLAPAFIASVAVLLDWAFEPANAGGFHFLTLFLAVACLVAHEWINAERSAKGTKSFQEPVLLRGLLRETSHIIVPLLLIGTLVSLAFPKSEKEPRVVHRIIQQSAELLTAKLSSSPVTLPSAPPASSPTAGASALAPPASEGASSVPVNPVSPTAPSASATSPSPPTDAEIGRLVEALKWPSPSPEEINQALKWAQNSQLTQAQRDALQNTASRVPAGPRSQALAQNLRLPEPSAADLEAARRLLEANQLSPADNEALSQAFAVAQTASARTVSSAPDLMEKIDSGEDLGNSAPGREMDLEAVRRQVGRWGGQATSSPKTQAFKEGRDLPISNAPSSSPELLPRMPAAMGAPKGIGQAAHPPNAAPSPLASAPASLPITQNAAGSAGAPAEPTHPPVLNPLAARNWERVLRVLLFIALSLAVLIFLSKIGKRVQAPDQDGNAKEARKRRKALMREIAKLGRTRLSADQEIELRHALFLEIMAAAGHPREEWLPSTDFSYESGRKFRSLAPEIRDVEDTFCDWRYGKRLPNDRGLVRFRGSFSRIAQWFGAAG